MKKIGAAAAAAVAAAGVGFYRLLELAKQYQGLPVDPKGGGPVKDSLGAVLVSIPSWREKLFGIPNVQSYAEEFHVNYDLPAFGSPLPRTSPFFAENFYFWGNSVDGEFLFTARLAFQGVDGLDIWPWFQIVWKGEKWDLPTGFANATLQHDQTIRFRAQAPGFGVLEFSCGTPLQHWQLRYNGTLTNGAKEVPVDATIELDLVPENVFMYHLHMDAMSMGRSLASVPWNPEFFTNLRSQRQERVSSLGGGLATIQLGSEDVDVAFDGSRDHNWGIRNWRFMWRYIYIPPVKITPPLKIAGVEYNSFIGSLVEYGNVMKDAAIGGLVSQGGQVLSFSGATSMRKFAPQWFEAKSSPGVGIGDATLAAGEFELKIGLGLKYVLTVKVQRGQKFGMWQHSFYTPDKNFEIHEALTRWQFSVATHPEGDSVASATGLGMMEFGANLVGLDNGG